MIKTILAPLSGGDIDEVVLDASLTIARLFGSHIECHHNFMDAGEAAASITPVSYLIGPALRNAMDRLTERGEAHAASALRHFSDFLSANTIPTDVSVPCDSVSASMLQDSGKPVDNLCFQARHHDLVVMGRPSEGSGIPRELIERILMESGQPILIVPGYSSSRLLETVAICWKDTAESARAVRAAMPLLRHAKRVIVVTADEGGDDNLRASVSGVLKHLAWHGVHASEVAAATRGHTTMDTLWAAALNSHADLLVMGGFSRGPMRELLFGGCTQSALSHGELPVFIVR